MKNKNLRVRSRSNKFFLNLAVFLVILFLLLGYLATNPFANKEIVAERTLYAKVYDLGDGKKESVIHTKPIHYIDEYGRYQDIDTRITESEKEGYTYEVLKGIYRVYLKKYFTDPGFINIYQDDFSIDLSSDDLAVVIKDGTESLLLKKAQPVEAFIDDNKASYTGVYGEGLDVLLTYSRSAFKRELVIDAYDSLGLDDLKISNLEYLDVGFKFSVDMSKEMDIFIGEKLWDGTEMVTERKISFKEKNSKKEAFTFVPPFAVDANGDQQELAFGIKRVGEKVYVTKFIPIFWLKNAVYPVVADDIISPFPSGDGFMLGYDADYNTANAATTALAADNSGATFTVGQILNTDYYIYRSSLAFDTSSIGSNRVISAASLRFYGSFNGSDTDFDITAVSGPAAATFTTDHYNDFGSTSWGTLSTSGFRTGTGSSNTLNLTTTSGINMTGTTYLGLRSSRDLSVTAPTGDEYVNIMSSETDGTANDPILTVVHDSANASPSATLPVPVQNAGARTVTMTTTVADTDLDVTSLLVKWSTDNITYNNATILSAVQAGGEGDGVLLAGGTISDLDTDNDGSVDLTITWDAGTDLDDTDDSTVYFSVQPNDGTVNGTLQRSASFVLDTADPVAAGNLTLASATSTTATLNFGSQGSDTNFSTYKVYYKAGASGVTISDTLHTDTNLASVSYNSATSTTLTGLSPDVQYVANILAEDSFGNSKFATEVAFYTSSAAPSAPTVTVTGATTMNLVVNENGNPTTTNFYLCSTTDGTTCVSDKYVQADGTFGASAVWRSKSSWGAGSGISITGLSPNTSYRFLAKARNQGSTETGFSSASTALYTHASPVTSVAATNQTTTTALSVGLAWTNNGHSGVKLEQATCSGAFATIYNGTSDASSTTYNVTSGISANTCYKFRISSYNGDGVIGGASTTVSSELTLPPDRVTNVTAPTAQTAAITLDWDAVAGADNYRIYNADNDELLATVDSASTEETVGGLSINAQYRFYVRAVSETYGAGPASPEITEVTLADSVSSLAAANATTTSANQLRLTWNDDNQNGLKVEKSADCGLTYESIYDNATTNIASPLLVSTSPNTCYRFRISSYNSEGVLNTSNVSQTSTITTAPGQVQNVRVIGSTDTTVTVGWDAVSGATSYRVYDSTGSNLLKTVTSESAAVDNLAPGSSYTFVVRAVNANGEGVSSGQVGETTKIIGGAVLVSPTPSVVKKPGEKVIDKVVEVVRPIRVYENEEVVVKVTPDNTVVNEEENFVLHELAKDAEVVKTGPENYDFVRGFAFEADNKKIVSAKSGMDITIPLNEKDPEKIKNLKVWLYDERGQEFVYLPYQRIDEENNTISVKTDLVGKFAVFDTKGKGIVSKPTASQNCERNTEDALPFADLDVDWATQYIRYSYGNCIVNGRGKGTFKPLESVTRAEFLKMVVEAFKLGVANDYKNFFLDVPQDSWHALYVLQGWKLGIINGDYNFRPNDNVSRAEALKMLFLGAGFSFFDVKDVNLSFKDISEDDWFYEMLKFAVKYQVVDASNQNFRPNDKMTRAEAVKIISIAMLLKERLELVKN